MNDSKTKDRILTQIKAFKHHGEITGLEKYINRLELPTFCANFATKSKLITSQKRYDSKCQRYVQRHLPL